MKTLHTNSWESYKNAPFLFIVFLCINLGGCETLKNKACEEYEFKSYPGGELGESVEMVLENIGLTGNVPNWVEPKHKMEVISNLGPKKESIYAIYGLTDLLWTIEPEDCFTRSPFLLLNENSHSFVFKFTGKVYQEEQIWISDLDTFKTKRIKYSSVDWIPEEVGDENH